MRRWANLQVKKPLLATNPYLADPALRRAIFILTVISSSAVEGVRLSKDDLAETRGVDWSGPQRRVHSPHKARSTRAAATIPHPGG